MCSFVDLCLQHKHTLFTSSQTVYTVYQQSSSFSITELDSELVAKGLLDAIRRVCEEWADSLPELTTPPPGAKHELSLYAMKNARRKMEDKHALCVDVNSLFGLKVSWSTATHRSPASHCSPPSSCRAVPRTPSMLCLMAISESRRLHMPLFTSSLTL